MRLQLALINSTLCASLGLTFDRLPLLGMKQPFFSIVTPVYNGSAFICTWIRSLLSQSFADWESIIIDDGSVDNTFQDLLSAISGDQRFKIYRLGEESGPKLFPGPYKARNVGLFHACGKYICFLDIDDYWLPNKLFDQYLLLCQSPTLELVYGEYYKVDQTLFRGYLKPRLDFIPIKWQILFCNPVPMLTSCILADTAKKFQFQAVGHEDYLYWRNIVNLLDASRISKTNGPAALYRCSHESVSGDKIKVLLWWIKCYQRMGYPLAVAVVFLVLRVIMEVVEISLAKLGVFASYKH